MLILFTILQLCDKDQIDNPVKVYHTYVPEQTEFQQLDLDELDEFIKEKELNLDTSLNTDLYLMKPVDNTVTSPIYPLKFSHLNQVLYKYTSKKIMNNYQNKFK